MTTIVLDPLTVYRITADPQLFAALPFLEPMRKAALSAHAKLGDGHCSSCTQNARDYIALKLGNALTRLLATEAEKKPNQLNTFKRIVARVLNTSIDEIRVKYRDEHAQEHEVIF